MAAKRKDPTARKIKHLHRELEELQATKKKATRKLLIAFGIFAVLIVVWFLLQLFGVFGTNSMMFQAVAIVLALVMAWFGSTISMKQTNTKKRIKDIRAELEQLEV